jgi:hypothetical protein
MDSANIERISKALANETRLLIFEAISRNKEIDAKPSRPRPGAGSQSLRNSPTLCPVPAQPLVLPIRPVHSRYLAASHIVVSTYAGVQTIPDKQLAAVGAKRSSCIRLPYFGVALECLPGTELVLTVTSGVHSVVRGNRDLRVVKAPRELHPFHFLMAWHPRLNSDPRHVWLREALRSTTVHNAVSGQHRSGRPFVLKGVNSPM